MSYGSKGFVGLKINDSRHNPSSIKRTLMKCLSIEKEVMFRVGKGILTLFIVIHEGYTARNVILDIYVVRII